MLAYAAKEFPEGIYLVGQCPSVGITGYATGGGKGETTPWVGLGIDDVLSYDIVLYDGTNVTASATENEDLYWALRGGGSGFGVITSIETAVISAPEEASNFTWRRIFGLYGTLPWECEDETNSTFAEAGLLDPAILEPNVFVSLEFSSWAEAQLWVLCYTMTTLGSWTSWVNPYWSLANQANICDDLGIDSEYCYLNGYGITVPNCNNTRADFDIDDVKNEILPAMKDVAIEPQSWFNRPGGKRVAEVGKELLSGLNTSNPDEQWLAEIAINAIETAQNTQVGSLIHGRVDPDVLLEMANVGVDFIDTLHGAPTLLERDETAYVAREEYSLLSFDSTDDYSEIASILVNQAYNGDASNLRGFYNHLNIEGNRNWREYYFGDNYERLSVVKAMYDETNGFGNPLQVEPAPLSSKSGKGKGEEVLFG